MKHLRVAILAILFVMLIGSSAGANPGSLDPTFGDGGIAPTIGSGSPIAPVVDNGHVR